MQKLPPLNSLKAFDAAARHLSFTAAASELYVTHGAVSRQIAGLEQELKVALFVRGARGLKLTAEGAQFARGIGTAFDTLRSAVAQVRQEGPAEDLRVSVPPTLAMRWLIPRMSDLHRAHPRLRIDLTTSTEPVDFEAGEYDAAIRRIRQVPRGLLATRFLDARPVPVCSPAYQEQHRLRGPADLRRATLILTRSEPRAWPDWLRANRVQRTASAHTIEFEQLYFALQAALDSLGVALAPASLVQEEVQRRRLSALAQPDGPVSPSYALLSPKVSVHGDAIRTFGEWLQAAARP